MLVTACLLAQGSARLGRKREKRSIFSPVLVPRPLCPLLVFLGCRCCGPKNIQIALERGRGYLEGGLSGLMLTLGAGSGGWIIRSDADSGGWIWRVDYQV